MTRSLVDVFVQARPAAAPLQHSDERALYADSSLPVADSAAEPGHWRVGSHSAIGVYRMIAAVIQRS